MVSGVQPKKDGNHLYTVDFGAYGAWYCSHRELSGDDAEGWEPETTSDPLSETLRLIIPTEEDRVEERRLRREQNDNNNEDEDEEDEQEDDPHEPPRYHEEDEVLAPIIDVEADIKRRMKELEKGY
jgi:hypothetical protein